VEDQAGYVHGGERLPQVSVSASRDEDGSVHVSLCNLAPSDTAWVEIALDGMDVDAIGHVSGQILTANEMAAHNTFDRPDNVRPDTFQSFSTRGSVLAAELAPMSVVVLEIA
jgi:alpha-N-arabinofuranosidase